MEALAREPNVHVKVSEFGLKDREWEYESNRRVVLDALAIFGVERAMFATNFPVAGLRIGYGALVEAMSRMLRAPVAGSSATCSSGRMQRRSIACRFRFLDSPRQRLAQRLPLRELGGETDPRIGRAGRGQRQIGQVRAAREMPVIKAAGAAAVERDGANAGIRVEQLGDRVRHFGADRRIGAGRPRSALDDIP